MRTRLFPLACATDEELQLIHDPDYIHAVTLAGHGSISDALAENYGLGTDDTPIFPNMHEASSLLVGGTLTAVDYVMSGKALSRFTSWGRTSSWIYW